jgi:hypothetical protein
MVAYDLDQFTLGTLALHQAIRLGAEPRLLVMMMTERGERSRARGRPAP